MQSTTISVVKVAVHRVSLFAVGVLLCACAGRNPETIAPQLERPAHPYPTNVAQAYPAELAGSRDTGRVTLTFLVTAEGLVDTTTIQVVESTHPLFAAAARAVLPQWRFQPATIGGTLGTDCQRLVTGVRVCERPGRPGKPVPYWIAVPFVFPPPPA